MLREQFQHDRPFPPPTPTLPPSHPSPPLQTLSPLSKSGDVAFNSLRLSICLKATGWGGRDPMSCDKLSPHSLTGGSCRRRRR